MDENKKAEKAKREADKKAEKAKREADKKADRAAARWYKPTLQNIYFWLLIILSCFIMIFVLVLHFRQSIFQGKTESVEKAQVKITKRVKKVEKTLLALEPLAKDNEKKVKGNMQEIGDLKKDQKDAMKLYGQYDTVLEKVIKRVDGLEGKKGQVASPKDKAVADKKKGKSKVAKKVTGNEKAKEAPPDQVAVKSPAPPPYYSCSQPAKLLVTLNNGVQVYGFRDCEGYVKYSYNGKKYRFVYPYP